MNRHEIGIGKVRALQRVSTSAGHFTILAVDHVAALRRALKPAAPDQVRDEEIAAFKAQVTRALAPESSGVLLDPMYGAAQAIAGGYLGSAGLLLELENADYALQSPLLRCETISDWNVAKIKRMGGDGVKLFYFYNHDQIEHARQQDDLLMQIVADCTEHDIPFYAEPILYPAGAPTPVHQERFTGLVIAAAQRVEGLGADILKMEFPLSAAQWGDPAAARAACDELHAATTIPWVLLSAGVDFETFCQQVEIACAAGASGVIAGRAVWGDAAHIADLEARQAWLETTGRERMRQLAELTRLGEPWMERLTPAPITSTWYREYAGEPAL
ncbi:MAG: tagatose 1,6-diphosphate aldolase [Chloroflexi bacterium]|nr:tagatose 1,6-diphosphate aldolase [Chloroflexota bacterium]